MMELFRRRPILSAFIGLFVLVVLLGSFPIVPETKQAVIVRLGKPERSYLPLPQVERTVRGNAAGGGQ